MNFEASRCCIRPSCSARNLDEYVDRNCSRYEWLLFFELNTFPMEGRNVSDTKLVGESYYVDKSLLVIAGKQTGPLGTSQPLRIILLPVK